MTENSSARYDTDECVALLYAELRRLAARKLSREMPGHSLDTTGLVHEAYLRLQRKLPELPWTSRAHFFGAAAEAMRRILVERARSRKQLKRGGGIRPVELQSHDLPADNDLSEEILAIHESLDELEKRDSVAAALVKLRYFAGLSHQEAAAELGLTRRQADGLWVLAKTWLYRRLKS
jgi:RNA polymerase sigma factor (TIGR02999 family)